MDLDDDIHREDQFSSSYETPTTVTATNKEPTGMSPKFFEESILAKAEKRDRKITRTASCTRSAT